MKKVITTSLFFLAICCINILNAQSQWKGVPCNDCVNPQSSQKGNPNQVQNGNGTIATSYTTTACGLGFTTATVRLNRRSFGGMTVPQGVLQPANMVVSGIPSCFTIVKAFLYVGGSGNGVAITANITNPLLVAGAYPMTMIGTHTDKCWGYAGTYNYRADVTAAISGNGTYVLSGIPCLGTTPNDMDGATLIIMYTDPTQTFTGHMVIGDGCREVSGGTITNNITGFNVCGATNSTQNFVIVSDLQQIANTPINFNSAVSNYTWASASNNVWDYIQQPGAPATAGQTSATYGFSNSSDCYNFVAAGMYYRTACNVCTVASNLPVTAVTSSSCAAGSATATVSGGTGPYTYTWTPTGGNTATITGAATGNYTVTVRDATGCKTGTAVVAITSASAPTLAIIGNTTICAGQSTTLTVSGASTYTWSPGATLNTTIGNVVVATPPNTITYSISGTSTAGCVSTRTMQVVVNPLPVPVVGSNSPLCAGQTLNLTSTGGGTYSWSGPSAFSSALQNPTVPSVTSTNAGVYTVTVTTLGCTGVGTVNVVVNTPTSSASNTGPYCAGQTIQLNTPAATSFTWTGPNAFTSSLQNPTIPASTAAMTGVYSVTASTGGCISTATTLVTVNALPVVAPTNTGPYCPGNTIQLNVGSSTSYTWTGPSAFTSNLQNPTQTNAQTTNGGVYTVSLTSAQGCVNSGTTMVVVNPSPVVVIGSNSPVCLNSTINLTASGGTGYTWSGPNAFSSALQNPTIPSATAVNAGVYTVTVTSLGCTNTGTVSVTVLSPTTSASNTGPYCAGATIQLNTPAATSYTWTGPSAFNSSLQNPTLASAIVGMSGTYSVLVSAGTCTAFATTNVVVNPLPVPAATNTGPYCPGNTIQLNVGSFTTYTWTGPSAFSSNLQNPTQTNAQPTNSGPYVVTVADANGCINTSTTTVVVNPSPVIVIGSNSPVCINTAINLTSTGGGTYSWSGPNAFTSALQNPTIPVATPIEAGVYNVTVTTLGCTSTASVNVIVTTPTTSASNTGPYCAGTTINLSAPAATSYTWSGPGGYTSNSQNATQASSTPAMSGTYSVIVSIGTCTASATTNVVVNALPTPTATSNSPLCAGQTINLTGAGALTYTWTGPNSFSSNSATPSIPTVSVVNGGNYILNVTDANGCTNTTNVVVVVNALPTIAVTNPTTCVNTTINLTANGGVTYAWSGPGGFTSAAQNPNITGAQLTMSGVYVVTVTDANGCINTANANVSVLPLPTPNITSNSPVCAGGTLNLFGTGGAVYAWSGPGYVGASQNPVINNVTAVANGVYTLLVSSGTCTASTTFTVVINPTPVFSFAGSNVLCNGQSNGTSTVNVTVGTGPFNYNWSTIPSQTTQDASNLAAGTYSCIVTDANGCSSVASTQITQPTQFSVAINTATFSACANSPINVTAIGAGGTGPYSYNWVSGPTVGPYTINETLAGNYIYTVNAVDAFNCPATANINLTFFPQPTVTATSATLCAGQTTAALVASGATSYVWQPGNITGSTYPYSGNTSVNITVVGISNGCSNTANTSVIVNPTPNTNITVGTAKGCVPTCVTFSAGGASNITSYGWILNGAGITGAQNGAYCFDEAASYTLGLQVMDANGCTGTVVPVTIDIYPQPVADFNHAPIKPIINQDPFVTFTDASWGAPIVSWNWYFMNTAQYTSIEQNPTFMYTEPGTYPVVLVVKSDKGCTDTIIRPLVVGEDFGIYVPNAFTPNGDGMNDIFQPKGFGVVKYELNIFDRWGERVFHTTTFEEGWDGSFQGRGEKGIEEASYTWLINATSVFGKSHELKGHVTLIR
ncbi:MAG: gliding motility-associated C-terminal domain-containing protein [Sphingobacteriaceae bacterium]|nr:gliding motility-associated C-terminal domain-containing protein [Sphingobacteriaceae bacterium]